MNANHTEFKKRYNRMNNIATDIIGRKDEADKCPKAIKDA